MLRRPLQQPYDGPFKVLQRKDKVFSFTSMNETPATVESDPISFLNAYPSHLHVLVAKFIFQLGIVDTGRGSPYNIIAHLVVLDFSIYVGISFLELFVQPLLFCSCYLSDSQIEAHEIHRGNGLDVRLSLTLALRTVQVTVRFSSVKFRR
ncbi:hypothetical protein TNCV_3904191 [Trichonephila clavipes]|nr:hypothetical protein TNCV_3904191 [Trichonephila clavipes]